MTPERIRLVFAPFEFDVDALELRRDGVVVPLQRQPARVLGFLLEHAGRLVTRRELQDEVWGKDHHVDFEHGLNFCIRQIRAALGDQAASPVYVETLPRRGYRWRAPVVPMDAEVERASSAARPRQGVPLWAAVMLAAASAAATVLVQVGFQGIHRRPEYIDLAVAFDALHTLSHELLDPYLLVVFGATYQ